MHADEQDLVGRFAQMAVELREPAQVWPAMLECLQEAIGFEAGYIGASWRNASEGRGAVADHDEPFLRRNLGRYLAEIRLEEVALYTDRACVHHDVWSPERQAELSIFKELLHPSGMQHMIVRASVRNGNVAGVKLERRNALYPFSVADLRLVDLAAPFLHLVEVLALNSADEDVVGQFASDHHLTPRETELVELAIKGLTNGEIAVLKRISPNTVRNTLAKVFEKVGVSNRVELTYAASKRTSQPPSSSQHGELVPDDGLQAFKDRVQQASQAAPPHTSQPSARPPSSPPRIVYIAPTVDRELGESG